VIRNGRSTSIRAVAKTSQMRKERSYPDRVANGSNRPLLPSELGPANGTEARESGFRLKAWRCTRGGCSATAARLPLTAWRRSPRPVASGSSPCSALAHHTRRTGPGGGGSVRGVGSAARTRTGRARRIFGRPHRLVRERQRNMSRMDSQSNEFFSWCSPTAGSSDSSSARSASGAPWVRTNISLSTFAIPRK
jgi:hypothetical protein